MIASAENEELGAFDCRCAWGLAIQIRQSDTFAYPSFIIGRVEVAWSHLQYTSPKLDHGKTDLDHPHQHESSMPRNTLACGRLD